MTKAKLGKRYVSPEEKTQMDVEKERREKIRIAKLRLGSGLTGDDYKKAYKEYTDLVIPKKVKQTVIKNE